MQKRPLFLHPKETKYLLIVFKICILNRNSGYLGNGKQYNLNGWQVLHELCYYNTDCIFRIEYKDVNDNIGNEMCIKKFEKMTDNCKTM